MHIKKLMTKMKKIQEMKIMIMKIKKIKELMIMIVKEKEMKIMRKKKIMIIKLQKMKIMNLIIMILKITKKNDNEDKDKYDQRILLCSNHFCVFFSIRYVTGGPKDIFYSLNKLLIWSIEVLLSLKH